MCHRIRGAEAGPRRGHAGVLRAPRHSRRRQVLPLPLGKVRSDLPVPGTNPVLVVVLEQPKKISPPLFGSTSDHIFSTIHIFHLFCPSVPTHWCPYGDPRRLIGKRLPHDQSPTATTRGGSGGGTPDHSSFPGFVSGDSLRFYQTLPPLGPRAEHEEEVRAWHEERLEALQRSPAPSPLAIGSVCDTGGTAMRDLLLCVENICLKKNIYNYEDISTSSSARHTMKRTRHV